MSEPSPAAPVACRTCGFQPWMVPSAPCERTACVQPGSSWWHDKSGMHWLVCDRHEQWIDSQAIVPVERHVLDRQNGTVA